MSNLQQSSEEIWKDVKDFEGRYQVSNTGLVKSYDMKVLAKNGFPKIMKGRIRKISKYPSGYMYIALYKPDSSYTRFYIHRLVALHFIENPDNKPQVNHIDANKENNNVRRFFPNLF